MRDNIVLQSRDLMDKNNYTLEGIKHGHELEIPDDCELPLDVRSHPRILPDEKNSVES